MLLYKFLLMYHYPVEQGFNKVTISFCFVLFFCLNRVAIV